MFITNAHYCSLVMRTFIYWLCFLLFMLLKETLRSVVRSQREESKIFEYGVERECLKNIDLKTKHVAIISGIRRCGKSTLLRQLMKKIKGFYYFNFEDTKALGFELSDFERLDEVFKEEFGEQDHYFFDEIQNVDNWEIFVRKKQDLGKKFIITGSNASLLSKELGTRLTGRHLNYELFPFSYKEYLKLVNKKPSIESFEEYFNFGGFPEFLKYKKAEILQELLLDILMRDIVARYKLREVKILKELAIYLLTNQGKEFSYNKLTKHFNLGSINTTLSFISYFEDSYLMFSIPQFDYSYKKQIINPKKIYSIDLGLLKANTVSFTKDKGRMLENLVFLNLRRNFKEIYYFKDNNECDFIVRDQKGVMQAMQVCYELTEENKERELEGLKKAMKKLKIKEGLIITYDQKDKIDGIPVIPFYEWQLQ